MPRGNLLSGYGGIFHLTHRCHNRSFLLKFARDRDAYRSKLREHLRGFDVALLDYCVTANHVHLLVDAAERLEVSRLMRAVAGEFARAYNQRKGRLNAYWGDNYHATLVEAGEYLWRCLVYIELNMVRCGVVRHPQEWKWVGYHEIVGARTRYRLLDLERLCWRVGAASLAELRKNLEKSLTETIAQDRIRRESCWTEGVAVGSNAFVKEVQPLILSRRETEIVESDSKMWILKETPPPYGQKTGSKSDAKAPF